MSSVLAGWFCAVPARVTNANANREIRRMLRMLSHLLEGFALEMAARFGSQKRPLRVREVCQPLAGLSGVRMPVTVSRKGPQRFGRGALRDLRFLCDRTRG